jgi:hypothetical protein
VLVYHRPPWAEKASPHSVHVLYEDEHMVRTAQTLYLRLGISHATLGNKECSSHYINCLPIDNWPPHHWFTSLPPHKRSRWC